MASNVYADMTIPRLKDELRNKGAKISGKKHQLIERLESYDRNADFGQVLQEDTFNMHLPDAVSYRDINTHTQIPIFKEEGVEVYLGLFQQNVNDKVRSMYESKFLCSLRTTEENNTFFFRGRVSAEMIKKCIYTVDISTDQLGVVQEAQCECAAGMGPEAHCKHVSLVLYALTHAENGILTSDTCTQILQTFHQVKKYSGSPVKMADLVLRPNTSVGLDELSTFDPRPVSDRNRAGYGDFFRNIWLNSSAARPPIRQLYAPANIYGVVNDHDYLEKSPEELCLDALNVTSITEQEQVNLEKQTCGQGSKKLWKEERLIRLQSSNFGRICKATDRTDLNKLACSLTEHKNLGGEAIKHGRKYESSARKAYSEQSDLTVYESGIMVRADLPYIGCSPDGLVGDNGLIEIKCPYSSRNEPINPNTVPYLRKSQDGSLYLLTNHDYYFQIMGGLFCTGREWCDLVVWTFQEMKIIRISRDETFIQNMSTKLVHFFQDHFRSVLLRKYLYKNTHEFEHVHERM